MQSIADKILARIRSQKSAGAFSTSDFLDLGSRTAVDQALSRFSRTGTIRRISPGIYDLPRVSPRLGKLSPDLDAVARAIARKNKVKLQPAGALAVNSLGLSTQVPAVRVYFTEGFPKKFKIAGQRVEFRHGSPRNLAGAGKISGVVFQALRYLGPKGVTDDVIDKLKKLLSTPDKRVLRADARDTFDWIRPLIPKITDSPG